MSAPAYSELHEHFVRVEDLPQIVSGDPALWYVNGADAREEAHPVWGYLTTAELREPDASSPYIVAGMHVRLVSTTREPDARGFWHVLSVTAPRVRNVEGRAVVEAAPHRVRLSRGIPVGELCSVCGKTVIDPREEVAR